MLRLLAAFLLFGALLFGASATQELATAKKNLYSHSKERQFKAYDTYKRYYIKALINADEKTQLRCLDGICIAGKKLRIDVRDYEKKRARLESKSHKNKKTEKRASKVDSHTKTEKIKPSKKRTNKDVKIRSRHALSGFHWDESTLVLEFDFKLKSKDVNYFKLDRKSVV